MMQQVISLSALSVRPDVIMLCDTEMSLKQPKKESPTSFPSEKSTESKQEMESSSVRAGDASEIEASS